LATRERRMSPTERLLEEELWRLEVLAPLHAGSGEQLTKGLDVESADGWTYAVDIDKVLQAISPSRWNDVGVVDLAQLFPGGSLRAVQRYAMHGRIIAEHAFDPRHAGTKLRCFTRDGFGRPYLPGSALKGALRTALLAAIAEKDQGVRRALGEAARRPGNPNGKGVDTQVQQAAFRIGKGDAVDDVLRHLHVPDVPIPPAAVAVVEVKIASMNRESGWGWKPRKRGDANLPDPNDRMALATFVEVVNPGTVLAVPLRIDARSLRETRGQDFRKWAPFLLDGGLLDAVRTHGDRLLHAETTMWERSRPRDATAKALAALRTKANGDAVLPVGWGIGWRGMTGAALEWIDGDAARRDDANAKDPATLAAAREAHRRTMSGREQFVFPKSRRLAIDRGEPALPLGWVIVRPWRQEDAATTFEAVKAPEGRLPMRAFAARQAPGDRSVAAPVPILMTTVAKPGDVVRARLTGKNKNGKWLVALLSPTAEGVVVEAEGEPEDAAVGKEVDLVVKNTTPPGQRWSLLWRKM
jgi:CRISPR-associated protein Csm5